MRVTPNCDSINSFYINQSPGIQTQPEIAFGGGIYLVIWTDAGNYYRLKGARITPQGTVLDPVPLQIGPNDTLQQTDGSIAYNGNSFFVVWGSRYMPRLMGRFINPNGTMSDTIQIASLTHAIVETRVACSNNNYMIVWIDENSTVKGLIVNGSGMPITNIFTIANIVDKYSLSLCFDGFQYCVNYVQKSGSFGYVYGRKYDINGAPIGTAYQISNSTYYEFYCEVIPGINNRYLSVWSGIYGSSYDIYGNLDIEIVGVEEYNMSLRQNGCFRTRIITDPLPEVKSKNMKILDINGRLIINRDVPPGVYFLVQQNVLKEKIIKIK